MSRANRGGESQQCYDLCDARPRWSGPCVCVYHCLYRESNAYPCNPRTTTCASTRDVESSSPAHGHAPIVPSARATSPEWRMPLHVHVHAALLPVASSLRKLSPGAHCLSSPLSPFIHPMSSCGFDLSFRLHYVYSTSHQLLAAVIRLHSRAARASPRRPR